MDQKIFNDKDKFFKNKKPILWKRNDDKDISKISCDKNI